MNVVITGANRGIGLALATRFAARDEVTVFALARDLENADDLHALAAASSGRVKPIALDVSDGAAIANLPTAIGASTPVHLLVNNAGASGRQEFGKITQADLVEIFSVNTFGPLLVAQAIDSQLQRGAKIVNITSVLGSIAQAGSDYLSYGMSKAALNMFSKKLALELRDRGVAVLALHPGWVRTRMGGEAAALDVDHAADGMVDVIDAFDLHRSGAFLTYDGSELPW